MEYLQSFMENAEYISEKDFGFVAESVNLQCYAEDTFVARANDVLDFMGSNDIDSFDEALNYVAEAHGIQYQPIMAIKESDIDMAVMFAEMGDSSLLEAYDAIIEQCVEENVALVLEANQSEQPAQSKPGFLAKTGTKLKGMATDAKDAVVNKASAGYDWVKDNKLKAAGIAAGGAAAAYLGKKYYDRKKRSKAQKALDAAQYAVQDKLGRTNLLDKGAHAVGLKG